MRKWTTTIAALTLALVLALPLTTQAQTGFDPPPTGGSTLGTLGGGSVLIGNGTSDAQVVRVKRTSLTNAQMLDLGDTAVTVVADPGDGYVIDVIGVVMSFDYTAVYTGGSNLQLYYGDRTTGSAASGVVTASGFVTGSVTADTVSRAGGAADGTILSASTAVVVQNVGAEFGGGNASNAVDVQVFYRVLAVP